MPLHIVRNDITKMHVDAIVNTASPVPGYGAGIDTAVYEAAGKEKLLAKRREIGTIERGSSAITVGYKLPAKYIIHTVGTAWQGGNLGEEDTIRSCYKSIFTLAVDNSIESLAIPLLASGSYGFPKGIALRIAISEIEAFLSCSDMEIFLVVFDDKSFSLSTELYGDIDSYISDNYVEKQAEKEYSRPNGFFGRFLASGKSDREKTQRFSSKAPEFIEADEPEAKEYSVSYAMMAPARSLDDVVNSLEKSFMEMVFSFADEKGMTDVEVQKKANIERKAFSKLKCGTTKNPSKATALALCVALELNLDETKDLLSRAGLALSPCSKQDVIVQYFIEKKAYNIFEINVALFEHGEPPIGSQID